MADHLETVCGELVLKGWSKTFESWNAGGSNYYVLNLDSGDRLSAAPDLMTVILRPTPEFPLMRIDELDVGSPGHACVVGEYVEGTPYVPQHPWEQYPIDGFGNPASRGSGLRVHNITTSREAAAAVPI